MANRAANARAAVGGAVVGLLSAVLLLLAVASGAIGVTTNAALTRLGLPGTTSGSASGQASAPAGGLSSSPSKPADRRSTAGHLDRRSVAGHADRRGAAPLTTASAGRALVGAFHLVEPADLPVSGPSVPRDLVDATAFSSPTGQVGPDGRPSGARAPPTGSSPL